MSELRDLYNIVCAWDAPQAPGAVSKVDPAGVGQAFRFYMEQEGSPFEAATIEAELARRMISRKFLSDMKGYLAAGATYSPETAYRQYCQVFLPHL